VDDFDFNPYAAPATDVSPGQLAAEADEGRGVWRDGKTLVMSKYARLPSRCLKCNAPATNRSRRTITWHHPAYLLLWLLGPICWLVYLIVAIGIVNQSARIEVPVCERHRARRFGGTLVAWLSALSGVALWFVAAYVEGLELLVVLGWVLFLFGVFFGLFWVRVLVPRRIDKTHIWLGRISPLYLAELPPLPFSNDEEASKAKAYIDEL
jgi:hypothetical protein